MNVATQLNNLTKMEIALTESDPNTYFHGCYSTCALGVASSRRDLMPDLPVEVIRNHRGSYSLVEHGEDGSAFDSKSELVDGYFGDGAYRNVFSTYAGDRDESYSAASNAVQHANTLSDLRDFIAIMQERNAA